MADHSPADACVRAAQAATTRRHLLTADAPSTRFADCFLLGNGTLGAATYGRPGVEQIEINIDSLWSGGPNATAHEVDPQTLADLRAAIAAGGFVLADSIARAVQSGRYVQAFQPVGALRWGYGPLGVVEGVPAGYVRSLDMARAIAATAYAPGIRLESFVTAVDDVLVVEATGAPTSAPTFDCPHPSTQTTDVVAGVTWLTVTGRGPSFVAPNYVPCDAPLDYGLDEPDAEGLVDAGMGFAFVVAWQPGADGGRLVAAAESGFRGWDARPSADVAALAAQARRRVASALSATTDELRQRHVDDHAAYFDRCDLDLSASAERYPQAARAELFFDLGRYLLVVGSRPGSQPLNLQGLWSNDLIPAWSCNYTTNINAPMNYWGAEVMGLGDLHEPFLDLVSDVIEAGERTARQTYGARGACAHHNTDIWRFTDPCGAGDAGSLPQWSNWASALWWLADHPFQRRAFLPPGAQADEVLVERVLPALRASALFALDMLVEHEDGSLVVSPSSSPEAAFMIDGKPCAVSAGAAMDQELVHEVLGRAVALIGAHGTADGDAALVAEAAAALTRLRMPAIIDGVLAEWAQAFEDEEPGHRHLSHLYGLFPGTRITRGATPEAFRAARAALDKRMSEGSGYTGWSMAWVLCLAARLGDRALAAQAVETLCGPLSSESMLDLHPHEYWPGGAVFQIDGNLGGAAGLAELLVQSHEGTITVLPTLLDAWPSGSVRGLRVRGGHAVDIVWRDHALGELDIHPASTTEVELDLPAVGGAGRVRRNVTLEEGVTWRF